MHERFALRIEEGLGRLARRVQKAQRTLDRSQLERQIGRLLERNSRPAGRHLATLAEDQACRRKSVSIGPSARSGMNSRVSQAEAAFRIRKSELSIRPVWHQKKGRVPGHIFVCLLAYVLWKTIEQWQKQAGLGNSPRTILDELARWHSADIVLPTAQDPPRDTARVYTGLFACSLTLHVKRGSPFAFILALVMLAGAGLHLEATLIYSLFDKATTRPSCSATSSWRPSPGSSFSRFSARYSGQPSVACDANRCHSLQADQDRPARNRPGDSTNAEGRCRT